MELISRQALIKDAESWVAVDEHERHLQKNVVEWLKEFPSAEHGTNLAEVGTDCISRRAAIDALDVLCLEHRYRIPGKAETYSQYNEAWQDALDRAEGAIGNLPPAEPKRGKWERHYSRPNVYADLCWHCSECGYRSSDNWAYKFNFCPHCGAKMEGEDE